MPNSNYDTIFQCSIEEYAQAHGQSVEDLIAKAKKDIEIMRTGKKKIFEVAGDLLSDKQVEAIEQINGAIERKEAHVKRLEAWIKNNKEER